MPRDNIAELGKNTRFPFNDPTKGGRKPSLKKQLANIALSDGWLEFDKNNVEILEGKVRVKVPKEEEMALKLFEIASGKNPKAAISAIKLYLETFDGKADGNINVNVNVANPYAHLSDDQIARIETIMNE